MESFIEFYFKRLAENYFKVSSTVTIDYKRYKNQGGLAYKFHCSLLHKNRGSLLCKFSRGFPHKIMVSLLHKFPASLLHKI